MINIQIKQECPVCLEQTTVKEVFKLAFKELDDTLCPNHHCMLIGYITKRLLDWDDKIEDEFGE